MANPKNPEEMWEEAGAFAEYFDNKGIGLKFAILITMLMLEGALRSMPEPSQSETRKDFSGLLSRCADRIITGQAKVM